MTPRKTLPAQARLQELFDYHEDGYLVRRVTVGNGRGGRGAGDPVRGSFSWGYLRIGVDGVSYQFHRLIFMWHHGWCPDIVDHYPDSDPTNCRIGNLRPATPLESTHNRLLVPRSSTGMLNIHTHQGRFYFRVRGRWSRAFATAAEASTALQEFRTTNARGSS